MNVTEVGFVPSIFDNGSRGGRLVLTVGGKEANIAGMPPRFDVEARNRRQTTKEIVKISNLSGRNSCE